MEAASASALPSISSAFLVAVELIAAMSLSFWPLIFAASPRPSERKRGPRLAAEDVVEARKRAAFVIEPIVVENRIADVPARKAIHDDVEFVLGGAFGRRSIPGQDALVEPVHFVDDRQLYLQSGRGDRANDFAETRNDNVLVLMNDKQERSPLQRCQNKKDA